ncbi:myotubularin-related protein 10-A-like isoform X2 [Watersipora subatra]|uniref:myotubularin-related protein 10-A-like isoform X2 n=1 Tax=Watersipora subatra TaxID=2589382 RepID=UPI00355B81EB
MNVPQKPKTDLMHGESEIATLKDVRQLQGSNSDGRKGNLICTNFRLRFVTVDGESSPEEATHNFIGTDDIPLCKISAIYKVSNDKKKRLKRSKIVHQIGLKCMQVYCKDLGVHTFNFEPTKTEDTRTLIQTILHFASPDKNDLLFVHDTKKLPMSNGCGEGRASVDGQLMTSKWKPRDFLTSRDFEEVLPRPGTERIWRITELNRKFKVVSEMPESFIVPAVVSDRLLREAATKYDNKRLPAWTYTHTNGYSLLTSPTFSPEAASIEIELSESVKRTGADPLKIDLTKSLCSVSDIQTAFAKMFSICAVDSDAEFHSTDNSVYSQLDSAHWLRYISFALRVSCKAARRIRQGRSSVIITENGSDLSCMVSSLVQIMLDPSSRTIKGFQALVQRCWVAAGHPFCERLNLISSPSMSKHITPVFLFFLDCVHQLMVQYPSAFEFSEIYLISLWDSCLLGLFREFIYSTNKDRVESVTGEGQLPSVWEWELQYSTDYLALFRNPLYQLSVVEKHHPPHRMLKPIYHLSQIEVWTSFFYRHTAPTQIINGGKPAEYFQQCLLVEEVTELLNRKARVDYGALRTSVLYFNAFKSSSLRMLQKLQTSYLTSTFPFKNSICRNVSDISLCKLLEHSEVLSNNVNDDDIQRQRKPFQHGNF